MDGDGGGRNAGGGAMSLERGADPAVGGFLGVKADVLNSFLGSNHGKKRLQNELPREARAPVAFSSGIEFPLALGGKDRGIVPGKAAPAASQLSGSSDDADDGSRPRVSEMDFFSDEKMKKAAGSTARSPSGGDEARPKTGTVPIKEEDFSEAVNTRLHLLTANTGSDQSTVDDGMPAEDEKDGKSELATMEAALARMKEENHRLRGMLSQVTANYNTLQTQVVHLVQQRNQMHTNPGAREAADAKIDATKPGGGAASVVPRQFMDLGPATAGDEPSNSSTEVGSPARSGSPQNIAEVASTDYRQREGGSAAPFNHVKAGIGGDDGREDSPEGEARGWAPNKLPKLNPANNSGEQSQEAIMRKARVSVRARSDAPMIADGCQWRKYGQKMAKGNPCPRAYYRCTMAAGCPVRKQVQRCAEDRSVLITTYEGTHNHPLPVTAMGFASTTAAAASMLLSGSMPSADGMMCSNFLTRTLLPSSSSMATISASAPFPTVTLDLTNHPAPPHLQKPPQPPPASGIFPFTAPDAAPAAAAPSTAGLTAQLFGQALSNQSKFSGLHMSQDANHHRHHPQVAVQQQQPPSLADTVSAATAAITSDPNFKAALAAAIKSIIAGASHPPAIDGNPLNILNAFNSSNTTTANIRNGGGGGGNSSYLGS